MKLYICGKISGEENYFNEFQSADLNLQKRGYKTVNPVFLCEDLIPKYENLHSQKLWQECLRRCLIAILDCDGVALVNHKWTESKGAKLEVHTARKLEIKILYCVAWLMKIDYDISD